MARPSPVSRLAFDPATWFLAGAAIAIGAVSVRWGGPVEGQSGDAIAAWEWQTELETALELARDEDRLVFVYFRPASGSGSPAITRGPRLAELRARVVGLRVSAAEVVALRERLGIATLPAVALLDARENVAWKREGSLAVKSLWTRVRKTDAIYRRRRDEDRTTIERARETFSRGALVDAFGAIRPFLESTHAAPSVLDLATDLEAAIAVAAKTELRVALAAEGLISDSELIDRVGGALGEALPRAALRFRESEIARIRGGTLGGVRAAR